MVGKQDLKCAEPEAGLWKALLFLQLIYEIVKDLPPTRHTPQNSHDKD